jgi:hypothetical protein
VDGLFVALAGELTNRRVSPVVEDALDDPVLGLGGELRIAYAAPTLVG